MCVEKYVSETTRQSLTLRKSKNCSRREKHNYCKLFAYLSKINDKTNREDGVTGRGEESCRSTAAFSHPHVKK